MKNRDLFERLRGGPENFFPSVLMAACAEGAALLVVDDVARVGLIVAAAVNLVMAYVSPPWPIEPRSNVEEVFE